jgi:hypothetical protein
VSPAPRDQSRDKNGHRFRRLAVVYDIDGPRVRLGLLWFLVALAAWVLGPWGLAVVYGVAAGAAAMQTARCWLAVRRRPDRVCAGAGAVALCLAAAVTTGLLGVTIVLFAAAAVILAASGTTLFGSASPDGPGRGGGRDRHRRRFEDVLDDAGFTIRSGLFVGFAAACVVVTDRFSVGAAIALLVLVGAYETGDYLIGSGSPTRFEGPIAGGIAQMVAAFAITALGVKPFTFPEGMLLGAMAAVLCPLGQLLASLVLPAYDAPASALRRLDSLLLLAPAWALTIGVLVQ